MNNDGIQQMERHKSLYFLDGNVLILARRPDNSGMLFRVHKSVLASHSPIFSDMFDVCTPPGCTSEDKGDDVYDGVPLIRFPDNPDHIGSVLQVFYYQSDLPQMPRSPYHPAIITPMLELSRKYGIDRMYAQIMRHLESDWPQTLNDWDKLEGDVKFMINHTESHIDDHFPEPAATIKLAREFNVHRILPAAFYHLSRLSILDDWDKTHADPSMVIGNPTQRTARWELLSGEDYRCLLLGKAKLAEFFHGNIKTSEGLRHVSNMYTTQACNVGKKLWEDIFDECSQSPDPLALLQMSMEEETQECTTCARTLKAKIQGVRAQIWEELGDLFHITGKDA